MRNIVRAAMMATLFQASAMASGTYVNFAGIWNGRCETDGLTQPSRKEISQTDDRSITINGQAFDLTKPSVVTLDGLDQGDAYREVTVYDFQWDSSRQLLNTSARWVGWYLDKPGAWSGSGTGVIKIENSQLITTRSFGATEEICIYPSRG